MSKITQLKKIRRNAPELLNDEFRFKTELKEYPCPVCDLPMYLAPGQIQASHKKCKKEFRRIEKIQKRTKMDNFFDAQKPE